MKNTYTPEIHQSQTTPKAPLFCGLINPPSADREKGVTTRQIISIVGLYNKETNGFEVRTVFGCTDYNATVLRQTEEKKQRLGEAFDGNFLYDCAQQGFYSCKGPKQENQEWALLCCWMDSVCKDVKSASEFVYSHALIVAAPNGYFDMRNPLMKWTDPKEFPLTLENAKTETYQRILNEFYPDEEEPVWKISSWHPSVVKRREREAQRANSLETSVFGIAPKKKSIHRAELRLDNRTKQIINNTLRRELGMEVYVDKESGELKVRESRRSTAARQETTEMAHAFDVAGVA